MPDHDRCTVVRKRLKVLHVRLHIRRMQADGRLVKYENGSYFPKESIDISENMLHSVSSHDTMTVFKRPDTCIAKHNRMLPETAG